MRSLEEQTGTPDAAVVGSACDHANTHPINQRDFPTEHIEWAKRIARGIHRNVPPTFAVEDFEQEAVIEAWKRWGKWDPARNDNFQGYAYLAVANAVKMSCRRKNWTWNTAVLGESHFEGKGGLDPFMKVSENPETQLQDAEEMEDLQENILSLPEMERAAVAEYLKGDGGEISTNALAMLRELYGVSMGGLSIQMGLF